MELSAAFDVIKRDLSATKYCFFVDGLDEYDGDQTEIITILKGLATSPNIKICRSSRPWNHFMEAFGTDSSRMLRLQELTRDYILLYVENTLEEDSRFALLAEEDPRCNKLAQEIVENAHGVVLWVLPIVRSLLRSLTHADDIYDLSKEAPTFVE